MKIPLLLAILLPTAILAAEPGAELAGKMSALRADGSCVIRARLQIKDSAGAEKTTLQLQIKSRATRGGSDFVYQVLFPKERKGEALLLRGGNGRATSGAQFSPPETMRNSAPNELFGSDLTAEDVLENFYAWESQTITGTETVDRVSCQVLESKSGKRMVRSFIDPRRMVPLRIERYSGGQLVRKIETTRVATDDLGRHIPANLTITNARDGSSTDLDGSRIKHGAAFTDRDFSPEGLRDLTPPRNAPE